MISPFSAFTPIRIGTAHELLAPYSSRESLLFPVSQPLTNVSHFSAEFVASSSTAFSSFGPFALSTSPQRPVETFQVRSSIVRRLRSSHISVFSASAPIRNVFGT